MSGSDNIEINVKLLLLKKHFNEQRGKRENSLGGPDLIKYSNFSVRVFLFVWCFF